jgi:flagellar basal-body rod protein FlgB
MGIADLPLLSMLKSRMSWHQERQRVLAENVSNSDTPGFRARDLSPLKFEEQMIAASGSAQAQTVSLERTASGHIAGGSLSGSSPFRSESKSGYEVRPTGNSVSLEDEMMKVSSNQMDYQAATALYTRSLALLKTAMGKR